MFQHVKSNKISEVITEQIRAAILDGRLKAGDRLSPERELMKNFNVSKATLREALRSLEALGFLSIRKGVSGGAFVTEVDMKTMRDAFINFLHFKRLSLADLSHVRKALEPYTSALAASDITDDDLRRLEEIIACSEQCLKQGSQINPQEDEVEFHRVIASVTGNPILIFMLDFVENLLVGCKDVLQPDVEFSRRVCRAHKRIYKALLERNGEKARLEMMKHVEEVERDLIALQRLRGMEEDISIYLKQNSKNGSL
ncbi:MAG: FadR family transcriptional regulator [Desulfobacteraceae bacterium]|nr:MAG: FadR family transcriptional regulator [Desulfobacteraceae bacterium]